MNNFAPLFGRNGAQYKAPKMSFETIHLMHVQREHTHAYTNEFKQAGRIENHKQTSGKKKVFVLNFNINRNIILVNNKKPGKVFSSPPKKSMRSKGNSPPVTSQPS